MYTIHSVFLTTDKDYGTAYFHSWNNAEFTCSYLMDSEKDWGYLLFTNSEYGDKLGDEDQGNGIWRVFIEMCF